MSKILKKVIAVLLVITLAGANLSLLGMYGISYAISDSKLAEQTPTTEHANVEFNSYFEDGGHNRTENIDSTTAKIYVNVKVKNAGYLKNAVVQFENVNFKIGEIHHSDVQSVDKQSNKIVLKQLNNGSDVTLEIPISILRENSVALDHFAKETKAKFTGIYVDANGKEKNISKEIINKLSWEANVQAEASTELTKYIPYIVGEKFGVMIQAKVKSGIIDTKLPIKKTQISLQVPEINSTKPTSVNVIANTMKATRGEADGLNFVGDNYQYDSSRGIVTITVENTNQHITWLKDVQDEYLITFMFESKELYDYAKTNGVDTKITTSANIEVYQNEVKSIPVSAINTVINRTEKLGTIADFDIDVTDQISKGQIYSNYDVTKKKEVSYFERYITTINSSDLTDTIQFGQGLDKFLTNDNTEGPTTVSGNHYTYNKTVVVEQNVFDKILGEDGTIDVFKTDKTKIGTINKQTQVKDGNYVLDISSQNTNEVYLVASKPQTEGKLAVMIEKAIKTNIDYSKTQMKSFTKLEASLEGKASTSTVNATKQILLKEPTSVAKVEIGKTDLTTVVENQNVEIRAILNTANVYHALYKNPTLKITLPSDISKVELKNYDILMANGLKIKGEPQVTTENGKPVILITLEGMQEEYTIGAEYEGTIIVLNTDLTAKTLTTSHEDKITMEFTNENAMSTNNKGTVEAKVNFVAPTGVVAANGISGYAEDSSNVMSISDEIVTGEITAYTDKKVATVYGKVVNNYANAINQVVILGRIPVKDNKKIDTQDSLGSTFNTTLNSNITVTGIDSAKYTVYYSENIDATTDLSNSSNGWTTTATTETKSYMIVTKDYEMPAGKMIEFSYNVEIPANLKNNNSVYEMYKVYYNNLSSIGRMAESKTSPVIGLTTGAGPELETNLTAAIPAEYVREGQIIKMKATVKNIGKVTATNVKLLLEVPEYTQFAEYYLSSGINVSEETSKTLVVGTLNPGEIKEVIYYIKVKDDTKISIPVSSENDTNMSREELNKIQEKNKFPKTIIQTAKLAVEGLKNTIPSNECRIVLNKGNVEVKLIGSSEEQDVCRNHETMYFTILAHRIGASANNAMIELKLPQGMIYEKGSIKDSLDENERIQGIHYDENTNTLQIALEDLEKEQIIELTTNTGEANGKFQLFAKVKTDEIADSYSNMLEYEVQKAEVSISELSSTPKYVKEDEEFSYKIKVSNHSKVLLESVTIEDTLPEGVTLVEATFPYANRIEKVNRLEDNGILKIRIPRLEIGEEKEVAITVKANLLPNKDDKQVENQVTVSALEAEAIKSNIVTNIIEYDANAHKTDEDNPQPTVKRYKITGTAWIDSNKNGKRDSEETVLSGVPVVLLNKSDNKIVRDPDTQTEKRTVTGQDGKYTFDNLEPNEYLAIFIYDVAKYSLTEYQAKGVETEYNSDVIDINITIDGKRSIAGITDVIKITDSNIRDIDMGVYPSEKFDLSIDKTISKITLTTPTTKAKVYNYDDEKLTKVEVLGRSIGKSSVIIEYKIKVTNEGAVAGYAKKIVDYLPQGAGFNTELNKDWYLSDNGNVYNASLANDIIQPGETKEVKLILTKKITEDTLKTSIRNSAEIYESYNEQGLPDIDSTVANRTEDEDDYSSAETIISIVTGKIVGYTVITLIVIALLGFGIYEIKKRVLSKEK